MLKNSDNFSLPETEHQVLEFWKKEGIFKKTLEKNKGKKEFVFYEGPPTANGRPGLHHILARSFKDVMPRYKTMQGFSVPRKGGWDTHGLPVELEVEKQLGLKSKKEIEEYGIAAFNAKCRESVWTYKDEWERLTERMGFWLDMNDPYITYKNKYISVVWQILREIHKKELLFKGHKVVPWCPRCGTALSSHEVALGYKNVKENSVYIKFRLEEGQKIGSFTTDKNTFILSWTTTPWTLPGNVALAVGENIEYEIGRVKMTIPDEQNRVKDGDILVYAKGALVGIFENANFPDQGISVDVVKIIKGVDLINLKYKPLFDIPELKTEKSHRVYAADFVTTTDGTGVVHTAVMYGEDDYNLGVQIGLPQFHTVTEDGKFIPQVPEVGGMPVKKPESDAKIIEYLTKNGNFLKSELFEHDYPFCWRCHSPLLYYARNSWFIRMSALREKLKEENQKINWIPEYLREGRFGEWIKEAKDWAISRDRYWGTPLPIWECKKCNTHAVFSADDFKKSKTSGNIYFFARHGESASNINRTLNSYPEKEAAHLTERGKERVSVSAEKIKNEGIEIIIASDITRTKETAEIYAHTLGCEIVFEPRLREVNWGELNGKSYDEYATLFSSSEEYFIKSTPGGESRNDIRRRVWNLFSEVEKNYTNKKILFVSHEDPLWMFISGLNGWTNEEAQKNRNLFGESAFFPLGEVREEKFVLGPRDELGIFDFHKPYIDEIKFPCEKCSGEMTRTPEVLDVWFDSGSMPWAQKDFLFTEGKNQIDKSGFPADYIAEGIDQTRGWFYTLLAIGVLLGEGTPYKNVISLGLLLDKNGQKMSKSKGNIVNPWDIMEKYGADSARWFFYTVNPPGEMKKFDEQELTKISRQLFMILYNSFAFFDLYAKKPPYAEKIVSKHILDTWILTRLEETIESVTADLDHYEIGSAAKTIQALVDDISRWYIRRSRKRLQKPASPEDYEVCSQTLFFVLQETAKLLAPFTPFFAEGLYKSLGFSGSIHEALWPEKKEKILNKEIVKNMQEAREIASAGLAKRAELGIKVRQPLQSIKVKSKILEGLVELLEIVKEEINVKEILFDETISVAIELDTVITPELREEGILREVVRFIQELRQEAKLQPKDRVSIAVDVNNASFLRKNAEFISREVGALELLFSRPSQKPRVEGILKVDEGEIWAGIL